MFVPIKDENNLEKILLKATHSSDKLIDTNKLQKQDLNINIKEYENE